MDVPERMDVMKIKSFLLFYEDWGRAGLKSLTGREEYASIAKGGCAPFFFSVRRFRSYRHYAKLRLAKLQYGLHNDETRHFIGKIYLVLLFGVD